MEAPTTPRAGFDLHPRNGDFDWRDPAPDALRGLTAEQFRDFCDAGFTVIRDVFTAAELTEVTAAIDPFEAVGEAWVREKRGGRFMLTTVDAITFTIHLVRRSPVLRAFAAHVAIKDLCHDLIGDDVRLYWDQAVYKKAAKAQEFPWHQDNGYTFIEPQQYLTLWIPLVDVDEKNGCPWIAPGLHKLGTLAHRPTEIGLKCFGAAPTATPVAARAGDVIAFSSLAPHRTGPNLEAGSVRKAYILQYAPVGAVAWPAGGGPVLQDDAERQFTILEAGC